ncbi:N-6 DNA methylase [Vibrio sp. TH_r3]|uniref:N-6 DNA methylase n=1 Tax=Vibrio sp. TH_r3 TaxID=3082084 RepID=UPI002955A669|nr:N-6 DNA methylase [Vibrio sp. TH_r3]MDV7105381.1 N-6 DNA methylase [Vibrio sp. TH_r3]
MDNIDLVLRELLTIEEMREAGSFFTGQKLATKAVDLLPAITSYSVVLDPTCGAGNLLIEASRKLGVEETLSATLKVWGQVLWGFDVHTHFIEATKLRIIVEALNQGIEQDCDLDEAFELLPNIQVRDAFTVKSEELLNVTHILMNPPFTIMPSPRENYWKEGKVNAAGAVFDLYLRKLPEGCRVSAILPDVLRSGSRYNEFRKFVSDSMKASIDIWGRFNNRTDVDVFLLSGQVVDSNKVIAWHSAEDAESTISDYFEIRTGPLVAYRDSEEGPEYPYFYPKICPQWKIVTEATETRHFNGKALSPPFVVVKRTSSPADKNRASATLINLREPVAIENHMIVITPKDGRVNTCKKLMKVLQSQQTNDFLNKRIRLRHLTVGVMKDIPFFEA